MKRADDVAEELARALQQLRWILSDLNMRGLGAWSSRLSPENPPAGGSPDTGGDAASSHLSLDAIRRELGDCRRCRLHQGRTKLVFGEGPERPSLVFVGEGPGFDEDRQGRPFVGRAGKLLDKMIRAIGLEREQVYICNVVKCRPPENRTPEPDEIEACSPFLLQQIAALRPKVICALGACAAQTLLGSSNAVSRLRGKVHSWRGIPLVSTYHPAYLLRNPSQKSNTWQDLVLVYQVLHSDRAELN